MNRVQLPLPKEPWVTRLMYDFREYLYRRRVPLLPLPSPWTRQVREYDYFLYDPREPLLSPPSREQLLPLRTRTALRMLPWKV